MKDPAVFSWLRKLHPPALTGGFRFALHWLVACFAVGGILLFYASTASSAIFGQDVGWDALNVAVLAPFGAAWLIWQRRGQLSGLPARPWWPGLVGIAASCALWMLGDVSDINQIRQVALVAMLLATLATVLGLVVAQELAFPLLFLLFAANAFSPLVRPLMHLTAELGVLVLRLTGLPVRLSNLTIVAPFGRWQLIEACAGLDYILIFAMSGVLFASLAFDSIARKVLFVIASIAAAVLANALRTWAVVYAVYLRGGVDQDHNAIGWTVFAVVFFVLFAIGRRFSQVRETLEPRTSVPRPMRGDARGGAIAAVAALAIVGVTPAALAAMDSQSRGADALDGCRLLERAMIEREGAPITRARTECGGTSGRRQLPNFAKAMLYALAPDAVVVTDAIPAEKTPVNDASTLTTIGPGVPYRLTYWYEIGGIRTSSRVVLKWHLALARVTGHDARAIIVTELQALYDAR